LVVEDGKTVLKRNYFSCGCSASNHLTHMSCS
jgi:hypothetical protein